MHNKNVNNSRVFIRTTAARFEERFTGGDYDFGPIVCGGVAPNNSKSYASIGGNYHVQPEQNGLLRRE